MADPTVTVHDPETGDEQTATLPPDEYIVICGARREITYVSRSRNGTVQLTIKPKAAS